MGVLRVLQFNLPESKLMNGQQLSFLPKCARYALAASVLCISSGGLQAAPLLPGGILAPPPPENNPVGATLVFSTGLVPFTSPTISGSLRSEVWTNDASNPFGANSLTFVYQLINGASSIDAIDRMTVSSFDSLATDASFTPVPGPTAPSKISRSQNGAVVGFEFAVPGFPLTPNAVATPLVVQTNSTTWAPTLASLIDGSAVSVVSVAPVGIPEPTSFCLIVGALALLASARHRGFPRYTDCVSALAR